MREKKKKKIDQDRKVIALNVEVITEIFFGITWPVCAVPLTQHCVVSVLIVCLPVCESVFFLLALLLFKDRHKIRYLRALYVRVC